MEFIDVKNEIKWHCKGKYTILTVQLKRGSQVMGRIRKGEIIGYPPPSDLRITGILAGILIPHTDCLRTIMGIV